MTARHALLLTDVVDSTAVSERLGDEAMSRLWQAHDRAARDLLRKWRGREIDKSDGFLLLFADAADAIGYVGAYHRALATLGVPLKARAGLHVGPLVLRDNDSADIALGAKPVEVDGLVKLLAARVMAVAQGGQTLVTLEARDALLDCGVSLESLGHWKLKGFEQPVELFEVAHEASPLTPPPDTVKAYRVVWQHGAWIPKHNLRHSLPAERDAFIGRRTALGELAERFSAGARLVTVLGTGGIGKTRLAQRFGWARVGDYPGGAWFCDLSQARTLDGVVNAVARGLGVPLGRTDPAAQLGNALAGRGACLVILDNFEQVSQFAEATVGHWLDRAADARFLVTSREVLGIRGEDVLDLDPLGPQEAAALFVLRAEAARRDFRPTAIDQAAVDPLVKMLDGLPLAIELAAARVRVMPPRTLLQRMSERFAVLVSLGGRSDRQATLRATFDWSWDLLAMHERAALAHLSVFEGRFTLRAAEAVVQLQAHPDARTVVDVLQSLVEKSLVRQRDEGRFDMLVSVRDYAAQHLGEEGRFVGSGPAELAAARRRHCRYFGLLGEAEAVADSCADLDNLVSACRHAVELGDADSAVGALEGVWAGLRLRGPYRTGEELAVLVREMPALMLRQQARVDRVNGWVLRESGRPAEAAACFESALQRAREAGDLAVEGRVLSHLGDLHVKSGRMDEARVELLDALALARQAGDRTVECEALVSLGNLFENLASMGEAKSYYEAALKLARAIGDRRWQGGAHANLGLLHANQGRMPEAREHYDAALALARELGDRQWEGNTLCNLGLLHQTQNRLEDARATLEEALALAKGMGYVRLGAVVMCNLGIVHESMNRPDDARRCYEDALAVAREVDDRRSEGQFLNYLGLLHARQGRLPQAWDCIEAAEELLTAVRDRLNLGLLLCSRAEVEHLCGNAEAGKTTLAKAANLAGEVGAEPESELGQALARVGGLLGALAVPGNTDGQVSAA